MNNKHITNTYFIKDVLLGGLHSSGTLPGAHYYLVTDFSGQHTGLICKGQKIAEPL
jgi:hypothetical protein